MTKSSIVLILILLLAACLRFIGINPGFPPYHSDESILYSHAALYARTNNYRPFRYEYPQLIPIFQAVTFKLFFIPLKLAKFFLQHHRLVFDPQIALGPGDSSALFWTRYITATFGVGIVLLVYVLAVQIYSKPIAVLASILTAVNYRQVLNSHFILPDIYNAFFLLLAMCFIYKLYQKSSVSNYLFAAICCGLFMSTKYQLFAFVPLVLVHLYHSATRSFRFFLTYGLLMMIISLGTFCLINYYLFIDWPKAIDQLNYAAAKYRVGRWEFDFYPYSYLYHIGIGQITSGFVLLGLIISFKKFYQAHFFLLSVVIPFFIFTTFYTGAGFYTRNFVTITPILLLFAASCWGVVSHTFFRRAFVLLLICFSIYENLSNSILVPIYYSQNWNSRTLSNWVDASLPPDAIISAHSSVPLSATQVRNPYDWDQDYSLAEFASSDSQFAITNLDWSTNQFYWWMTQSTKQSFWLWNKPESLLALSYPSLALQELSDFHIFSALKPWQVPDSNFIVAKIPRQTIIHQSPFKHYSFSPTSENWSQFSPHNLTSDFSQAPGLTLTNSTTYSEYNYWLSPSLARPLDSGLSVHSILKATSDTPQRFGYVFVVMYGSKTSADQDESRLHVRLSPRASSLLSDQALDIITSFPLDSPYFRVGFANNGSLSTSITLKSVDITAVSLDTDYSGWLPSPIKIDSNLLYPNSHSNL